jgi:hypothetical protein
MRRLVRLGGRLVTVARVAWIGALFCIVAATARPATEAPKEREYSLLWDTVDNSFVRPVTRFFDEPLIGRKLTGHKREAANVDERDQVRLPSTWWQPRIGYKRVTVQQMLKGPGGTDGPAGRRWTVTSAKSAGVTPGFQIKDARGDRFLLKFDSPDHPELSSSSEVIGTLLFWAAGYNTPENTIVHFHPESLDVDPEATIKERLGQARSFTRERLAQLLSRVARRPDGTVRCVASRFLEGKPIGPFKYYGRRGDDPEDLVPHELRRELRGMWVFAAWTNHVDVRGPNSLDTWVTHGGRSFVRHHLIDFGSILGSSATAPRSLPAGTEYSVDNGVFLRQALTLGLVPFRWEGSVDPEIPSVGQIEAAKFDPRGWRPSDPNPAFDERTDRDVRWGARILAAFTDEHIRAAVGAAKHSDPRATEYISRVLIARRDALVKEWLGSAPAESAK